MKIPDNILEVISDLRLEGYSELVYTVHGGQELVFRPLLYYEYDAIIALEESTSPPEINDIIASRCTLYPKDSGWIDNTKAGVVDQYAQEIIDYSGWDSSEKMLEMLNESREQANSLPALIEIVVCTVYKSVSPEDLRKMTLREQLDIYAKAETIFQASGARLDIAQILMQDIKDQAKKPDLPVPPGMSTTDMDMLDKDAASMPDFDKIFSDRPTY
jgi:hypothetical protein